MFVVLVQGVEDQFHLVPHVQVAHVDPWDHLTHDHHLLGGQLHGGDGEGEAWREADHERARDARQEEPVERAEPDGRERIDGAADLAVVFHRDSAHGQEARRENGGLDAEGDEDARIADAPEPHECLIHDKVPEGDDAEDDGHEDEE